MSTHTVVVVYAVDITHGGICIKHESNRKDTLANIHQTVGWVGYWGFFAVCCLES